MYEKSLYKDCLTFYVLLQRMLKCWPLRRSLRFALKLALFIIITLFLLIAFNIVFFFVNMIQMINYRTLIAIKTYEHKSDFGRLAEFTVDTPVADKNDSRINNFIRIYPDNKYFTILMITDDLTGVISSLSIEDKVSYSLKHKYGLLIDNNRVKRPTSWSKIESIIDLFKKGYKWVWSIDRDTIIANPNIKVDKLLRLLGTKYSFVISHDCNTINAGSFFIRNSNWSINFLHQLSNSYGNEVDVSDIWYENKAIHLYFKHNEMNFTNNLLILPQWSINIYPIENTCSVNNRTYELGDFVLHFAGLINSPFGINLYKKYLNQTKNSQDNFSNYTTDKWLAKMNLESIMSHG